MAIPIWKDKIIDLLADHIPFRIYDWDNSMVVYQGVAHARPGETTAKIKVNDICADYLQNVLPGLGDNGFSSMGLKTLNIQVKPEGYNWMPKEDVTFYNDWSYEYGYDPATMGMSFPINGRIDSRMPIVWSGLDQSQVRITINYNNGTSSFLIIPVAISADFNSDFNDDFAQDAQSPDSGTAVFYPSEWDDVSEILIGNSTFKVVTDCARYALYYVNAFGGWDCYLIEGNFLETDNLKRYTREVEYDNREISNRGIHNFVNEITKTITLHTGWLFHDQGERMHHLINSTCVYLYDIPAGQMIPVTIPTTSCEYKTYKNQGNRLVNYTIQVQVAQNRIRR